MEVRQEPGLVRRQRRQVLAGPRMPVRGRSSAALGLMRSGASLCRARIAYSGELRRRAPFWPVAAVREFGADRIEQLGLLGSAAQIPGRRPAIARLVIAGRSEAAEPP